MTEFINSLIISFNAAFAAMEWLEFTGLASGLICVWLLIRQNIWTFPIGLIYSVVSVAVFVEARLYADVLLSGYYVLMNAYGWYFWLYGGVRTMADSLVVSRMAPCPDRGMMVWTDPLPNDRVPRTMARR